MSRPRRLVAAVASVALVAGMTAVVVVPAQARSRPGVDAPVTYKACANKDSGAIRLVVKGKKCKKNELKLEWNVQGPAGMQGPVGPQGPAGAPGPAGPAGSPRIRVVDGTGADVPGVVGVHYNVITRLVDGGLWMFDLSGAIISIGDVWYQDDQCAGTAYSSPDASALAATQTRIVSYGTGHPAFKYTSTTTTASGTWYTDYGNGCGPFEVGGTVTVTQLAPVARPANLVGPLTVVLG